MGLTWATLPLPLPPPWENAALAPAPHTLVALGPAHPRNNVPRPLE